MVGVHQQGPARFVHAHGESGRARRDECACQAPTPLQGGQRRRVVFSVAEVGLHRYDSREQTHDAGREERPSEVVHRSGDPHDGSKGESEDLRGEDPRYRSAALRFGKERGHGRHRGHLDGPGRRSLHASRESKPGS